MNIVFKLNWKCNDEFIISVISFGLKKLFVKNAINYVEIFFAT